MAINITAMNFGEEVESCGTPVLVDFWASWCGPCKMLSPIVDEIEKEYEGKIKVGKVNVDEEPRLAMNFSIQSIPTLLFFKNGKAVDMSVGVVPKEDIVKMIEK